MLKKIGYALILWVIPYVTAIPLMGLMNSDPIFFKTIMVVESMVVGAFLAVLYFQGVQKDFLKEGIILGIVWMVVNWSMGFAALLPFAGMTVSRYFLEIGLRYVNAPVLTAAIGYVLEKKKVKI